MIQQIEDRFAQFLGGFEQSPGCINVLDVAADGTWIVRAVNHTAYDPTHADAPRTTTMEHLWGEYVASRQRRDTAGSGTLADPERIP